ncbi:Dihydrofolate synthase/folylpolyglutamate synthase [bacterium HR40]|nr:Dihydrofolate synthase/folylpolyglutamate synthase [bacterium HR40]
MTRFSSELILARLHALHPKSIDLSLDRIERLLARLGHPERALPPVVHIAGTNGKGSTLAMLDAMAQAAGLRVHRYISPHLVRFNERILLHGTPIAESLLADVLDECERANGGEPITFFEITTAAAFLAFAAVPADLVLLETGLGGRLDATNTVDRPRLTLISPVSMDHEAHLGDRIETIAFEKAGILKPGVPAIVAPQDPRALAVIEKRAQELAIPLAVGGRDWQVESEGARLVYTDSCGRLDLPRPKLDGRHQITNAGLALAAARALREFAIGPAACALGLRRTRWPGRLQRLERGPLVELLPPDFELRLDGGHNPAAGEVLAESLPELARGRPVHLVVGMLRTKDARTFLAPLVPLVRSITAVPVPDEPLSREPAELLALLEGRGVEAATAPSVEEALRRLATAPGPALVLICGSLYLAGAILRDNG